MCSHAGSACSARITQFDSVGKSASASAATDDTIAVVMKKLLIALVVFAVALVAVAARFAPRPASGAVEFVTQPVELGTLTETVSATGTVQPREVVPVGCEATGRVVRVAVDVGQDVKLGDVLLMVDDRLPALRVQQARSGVELAQAEVQRAEAARDAAKLSLQRTREGVTQATAKSVTEQAETQVKLTEAAVLAAQARVKEALTGQQLAEYAQDVTTLRAPCGGVVLERKVVAGQLVGPAAHLFTLAPDLAKVQVVALVAEADVGHLRVGTPASFTVNARPDLVTTATVSRVSLVPASVPGTAVYYAATLDVANVRDPQSKEWALRPGMPASVDFVTRRHEKVWKLPAAAVGLDWAGANLSDAAKQKLDRWKKRGDPSEWQRVWTVAADGGAWPVFLRVGGRGPRGESGIQDGTFLEVLDWDPEEQPPAGDGIIRVITGQPQSDKNIRPGLKLF